MKSGQDDKKNDQLEKEDKRFFDKRQIKSELGL